MFNKKIFDFNSQDKLGEILMSDRFRDSKGKPRYDKYVKIAFEGMHQADRGFIEYLLEKFGDISFDKAVEKWRAAK